jgi:hypothetical protein
MKKPSWAERRTRARSELDAAALVVRVLDAYGIDRDVREHRIVLSWGAIVGERIAHRTWPDGLRDGVLSVRVANSAWLQELTFLKQPIIARANELTGDPPLVREVRFHLGAMQQRDADDVVAALAHRLRQDRKPRHRRYTPASGQRLADINAETAEIDDPALRAAIRGCRAKLGL